MRQTYESMNTSQEIDSSRYSTYESIRKSIKKSIRESRSTEDDSFQHSAYESKHSAYESRSLQNNDSSSHSAYESRSLLDNDSFRHSAYELKNTNLAVQYLGFSELIFIKPDNRF
jgi:hypothetical protein